MKLTGALLSIMQLVTALVPHARVSATSNLGEEDGRTLHEVAFRGGLNFAVDEDAFPVTSFADHLEALRGNISHTLFFIIPPNLLSETMREAIVNMDKVCLEIWYDNGGQIVEGSLTVIVNDLEFEMYLKEEYQIDIFPATQWEIFVSGVSNFNSNVMTSQGPCYTVE